MASPTADTAAAADAGKAQLIETVKAGLKNATAGMFVHMLERALLSASVIEDEFKARYPEAFAEWETRMLAEPEQ